MKVFKEIQKTPKALYLLITVSLITPLAILLSFYNKATTEAEKSELLIAIVIIICTETLAFWFLSTMKQQVEINKYGISFKYPPFKRTAVHIPMNTIEAFSVESYNFPNYGYKYGAWNLLKTTPSITIMGLKKVIKITYANGKTLLIGTQKPEDAIKTLRYYKTNKDEVF